MDDHDNIRMESTTLDYGHANDGWRHYLGKVPQHNEDRCAPR
jgi:hypothetical protein